MDKFQKETEKILLDHEKEVFNQLRGTYLNALVDIKKNVAKLKDQIDELTATDPDNKSLIQSKIYQLNYQKAMEEQLNGVLDVVRDKNVSNVITFLEKMYEDSFLSINYHLQQKKIPVIMPINHKLLVDVLNTPTADLKFSERLYSQMEDFKKTVKAEISRGIAVGSSYQDMARQISEVARVDMNRAYRIARTEGGRVSSTAKMDSMREAKKKGADVVKVWDATLDGNTRPLHRQLDQQWAEVDKPFKVGGIEVMRPHGFGRASEDVNCRCVLLSVPRWDLEDTVIKYDNTSGQLIKTHNYESWKKSYYEVLPQNERITKVVSEAEKRIERYKNGESVADVIGTSKSKKHNKNTRMNDLSKEDQDILMGYTQGYYNSINLNLRKGKNLEKYDPVKDLDKILEKGVVNEKVLYRTAHIGEFGIEIDEKAFWDNINERMMNKTINLKFGTYEYYKAIYDEYINLNKEMYNKLSKELSYNDSFIDKAFKSTSKSDKIISYHSSYISKDFGNVNNPNHIMVKYNIVGDINGIDISEASHVAHQEEVLLQRGTKATIKNIYFSEKYKCTVVEMSLENFVQEKVKTELVKAGINIDHGAFGKGIVKSVDGQIVTVDFGENGVRKLSKLFIEKLIGK